MTSFPFPVKTLPAPTLRRVLQPADDDYVHFEHGQHLPFDATAASFSPVNAWWLADAMLLAYWPEAEVERRFKSAGFAQAVPHIKKGHRSLPDLSELAGWPRRRRRAGAGSLTGLTAVVAASRTRRVTNFRTTPSSNATTTY